MNLDEFLHLGGAELSAVIEQVESTVGLGAGEVLLAVGSLVEGMGTSKSDLDLLWITTRDESSLPSRAHVPLLVGRCLVDVQVWRLAAFEDLLTRFETWSKLPWDITHAANFTLDERTLLHRLLHGYVLYKGNGNRVTKRIPVRLDVARLKLQAARQASRTIQVDMVGYREIGDYRTLVFAAQEVLGHAVDALLAGYQLTNPLIKWRSRMLDSVPSDWELALTIRPTGLTAGEQMWRLHRAPSRPDKKIVLEHAFRITTFARAVFIWAERQLVKGSVITKKQCVWPTVEPHPNESPLPYLDFDVDFSLGEERVTVGRLNDFSGTLEMSQREFALTLLFDGTTTAREAEMIVWGSGGRRAKSSGIGQLAQRVALAGFSVASNGEQSIGVDLRRPNRTTSAHDTRRSTNPRSLR